MFFLKPKLTRRRAFSFALWIIAFLAAKQYASAWPFSLDEGERLSEQIGHAAQQLQKSPATETTLIYRPREGTDQHYSVFLAKVRYQPHPPFDPPYPGLTVSVEKGRGGFCNYHVKFVGVPRALEVSEYGTPTEIVLRKVANEIDVVSIR